MLVLSRGREVEICIASEITIRILAIHKRQIKLRPHRSVIFGERELA